MIEAEYSESIYKGFIDGLCVASATFCHRREAAAVQGEFEEKQRNNSENWSQLRQNFEAFKGIKKLAQGPHETIPEALVRDVLARQYGIKPEQVTWQQIRIALADLGRDYPAITLVPSGLAPSQRVPESTSPPDSMSGEINRRAMFLAEYKAATKPRVLTDIRERFLTDAALLRIETQEEVCDRLTRNSDKIGAFNHPYKVASAGFREWIENLRKFAAGHVMTLARMAGAHPEWEIADSAEWARIQVAGFVDDELYPKRCRKCGKPRSEHSATDHEFVKPLSRIELWWRIVSGEEEDFDLHEYGRPERWTAPIWIQKNPGKTENFLRGRRFDFDESIKWSLHDAEGDARIELCLASVNPGTVAAPAPGTPNAGPLRFADRNSELSAQPLKTDSDAWIKRADELLAKHPSANYHRASELYQFATSMLSALYGEESPEIRSLRSNAERASRDKSAFQAGNISLLAQGAIKAARDDLKAGLTRNLKSAPEMVRISTTKGAVTCARSPRKNSTEPVHQTSHVEILAKRTPSSESSPQLGENLPVPAAPERTRPSQSTKPLMLKYRSGIKRAILGALTQAPTATDAEICRSLDADGGEELPVGWKSRKEDRSFFRAYTDLRSKRKIEIAISKIRRDLRDRGLLE